MIVTLEKLIELLKPISDPNDTTPGEALWIKFAPYPKEGKSKHEKTVETLDWRTADGNTLVQVHVNRSGAILGIEIFS